MWTRAFTLCTSFALAICLAHTANAQRGGTGASAFGGGSSGFGSSGMGGSSGFGGMGGGMGSSGFGGMGGGMGSSGFGGGGMGGMGSSGFGSSGMGGGMGSSGFGNSGMGGNNQPGGAQNFVGRGAQQNGQSGQNGMQGSRQMNQFFTNMNKSMSRGNKGQKGKSSTSQNPSQPMRMEVKAAFDTKPANANAVASVIQSRMTKILGDHHMSQPLITVQGDTAVITGNAKSDTERQTIGQLVALESGIRAVRNEMTAPDAPASPPSADTPSQPGS